MYRINSGVQERGSQMDQKDWAQDQVDKLESRLRNGSGEDTDRFVSQLGGKLIEVVTDLTGTARLTLLNVRGKFRVAAMTPYVNRATRPQVDIFMKDFDDLSDAETLMLTVMEADGFLAFGDLFRLSKGSGLRLVETIS